MNYYIIPSNKYTIPDNPSEYHKKTTLRHAVDNSSFVIYSKDVAGIGNLSWITLSEDVKTYSGILFDINNAGWEAPDN
jgi:hypothetical protein